VRDLVFGRPAHRRLGEQLANGGFITHEQLRAALQAQGSDPRPLGEVLVEQGALDREDLENMANYQATEDLLSLFSWKSGTFEFYKGGPQDPRALARLDLVPRFNVDGIVLEAARRHDEWAGIFTALSSGSARGR
jgi:hypothetical protein